jgi:hypothetical protein
MLRTAEQANGQLQYTIIKSLETLETTQSNMDKTAQRLSTSEPLNRELQNNLVKSVNIIEMAQSKLLASEQLNCKLQVRLDESTKKLDESTKKLDESTKKLLASEQLITRLEGSLLVAETSLSAAAFMARYSDYCMESIRTLQNKSGLKFKKWIQLEDAVISEIHEFTRDTMNGIHSVPLALRPAHTTLDPICIAAGSTVDVASAQIMFYKSRCNEVHSGLFFMEATQKNVKGRHNISDLHSVVPAQYNIYANAIEAAVREYAARFAIVL